MNKIAYFPSVYLKPFLKYFDDLRIPYQNSEYYIPLFEIAREQDYAYMPYKNVLSWLTDVSKHNQLEDMSYKVCRNMALDFLPKDVKLDIQNKTCVFDAVCQLMEFVKNTNNDSVLQIKKRIKKTHVKPLS